VILFTRVGGALNEELNLGDIGIVTASIDAEMDCRAYDADMELGQILFTNERVFESNKELVEISLEYLKNTDLKYFEAYVACASVFMDEEIKKKFIEDKLDLLKAEVNCKEIKPNVIEMEGSAIMQTAFRNNIPVLAIRIISDSLEGDAVKDFDEFIKEGIENYIPIVQEIIKKI
jgi:nucleoside phosphorylase